MLYDVDVLLDLIARKKSRHRSDGIFPLRRPDVCLNVEKAEREGHTKSRLEKRCCYHFFATPTRLAVGLGTKDYPRGSCRFAPVRNIALKTELLVPPRRLPEPSSVINFSTVVVYHVN